MDSFSVQSDVVTLGNRQYRGFPGSRQWLLIGNLGWLGCGNNDLDMQSQQKWRTTLQLVGWLAWMMGSQISFTPNDEILRLLQKTIEISRQTTDATGTVQLIQDIELMARLGYPTQALGHLQELSTEFEDSTCQAIVANVAEQLVVRRDMQRVLEFLQTIDKAPTWKDAVLMDCVQICLRHQQIDEAVRLITMVQDQRVRDRACFYIAVTYARMGQGEEGLQLVRDFQVELTPELGQHMLQASMHGRHYDWFLQHLEPLAEDKDRSLQRALGWAADHGDFEFVLQVMQSRFQPGSQQMELAFRTLAGQCDSASAWIAPDAWHPNLPGIPGWLLEWRLAMPEPVNWKLHLRWLRKQQRKYRRWTATIARVTPAFWQPHCGPRSKKERERQPDPCWRN